MHSVYGMNRRGSPMLVHAKLDQGLTLPANLSSGDEAGSSRRRPRFGLRFQLRLRTLLVVTVLTAVLASIGVERYRRVTTFERLVIKELGGKITRRAELISGVPLLRMLWGVDVVDLSDRKVDVQTVTRLIRAGCPFRSIELKVESEVPVMALTSAQGLKDVHVWVADSTGTFPGLEESFRRIRPDVTLTVDPEYICILERLPEGFFDGDK